MIEQAETQSHARIEVLEAGVTIRELYVPRREVRDYLQALGEELHSNAVIQALEVGVFCLERARTGQDMEFVRRQIDGLLHQVEVATQVIPRTIQEELLSKLGTQDGQVLAPMRAGIDEFKRSLTERLQEVRTLLSDEIDPTRDGSKVGKAIRAITDILDPERKTSVQAVLSDAVTKVSQENGALAKAVKVVVHEAIRPLAEEVNRLTKQIHAGEAVQEALDHTTAKGSTYEADTIQVLQLWARHAEVEVHHVGSDNQPGDILLVSRNSSMPGLDFAIVIEARDRTDPAGRRRITEDLTRAITHRKAKAGIYVAKTRAGLAAEVGEWAEGECDGGRYVATIHEHLITAARYILQHERVRLECASRPVPDVEAIESQLKRVQTTMDRVAEINRKVTVGRSALDAIRSEGEAIRTDVRDALLKAEEALRRTVST